MSLEEAPLEEVIGEESSGRRTLAIASLIVVLVAVGYAVVLFVGGNALQDAPLAREFRQARDRFRGLVNFEPPKGLEPRAIEGGPEVTISTAPSPIVVSPRPSPSLSPSFRAPAPDAPSIVTFTIRFTNTTGVRLTGVRISDRIPPGTSYRSGSASPDATLSNGSLIWEIGSIDPDASGSVSFQVVTSRTGRVTNRAVLTSNEAPPATIESSANVS